MRRPKEAEMYLPIIKGANLEGWHLFRINDDGINRKPFDITGLSPEHAGVAIEVKVLNHMPHANDEFPWSLFETHQRSWLQEYAKHEAISVAVFYVVDSDLTLAIVLNEWDCEVGKKWFIYSKTELDWHHSKITGWDKVLDVYHRRIRGLRF